jgi:hypothetical protein
VSGPAQVGLVSERTQPGWSTSRAGPDPANLPWEHEGDEVDEAGRLEAVLAGRFLARAANVDANAYGRMAAPPKVVAVVLG